MPYKSPSYQQPEYVSLVAAEIAIRIRELGMTPNQVADCCGIDRNAAMRAVRGHHLSARNMDSVLRGLGLTVSSMEARCPS